jgi:ribosomal-protein-alanine N-acetyltransferase
MKLLKSKNLFFNELETSDVSQKYVDWLNNSEVNQFLEARHSKNDFNSCVEYVKNMKQSKNDYLFGIFENEKNLHIGNTKLTISHLKEKIAHLGIFIGEKSYQGKGYATESIDVITQFALKELNLNRVKAGLFDINLRSLNCFLKCGYSIDSHLKNHSIVNNKKVGKIIVSITQNG